LLKLKEFYDAHNVTFWYNVQESEKFSIFAFLRSIFIYLLQVQTPLFSFICLSLAAAAGFADSRLIRASDAKVAMPQVSLAAMIMLVPGLFSFVANLTFETVVTGGLPLQIGSNVTLLVLGISLLLAILMSVALRHVAAAMSTSKSPPGFYRCSIGGAYFLLLGLFMALHSILYDQPSRELWLGLLVPVPPLMGKLCMCVAGLIGGLLILCGRRSLLGQWQGVTSSIMPFLLSGLIGYLFVYVASPGYLYSGYLYRLCPFLAFHADTLLALGVFVPAVICITAWRRAKKLRANFGQNAMVGVSAVFGVAVICYWGETQSRYMKLLPADRFAFIGKLENLTGPALGVVSNTYAAPFGYVANTWAYQSDIPTKAGIASLGAEKSDNEYLWFADRATNPNYRQPGLFVCFVPIATYPLQVDFESTQFYTVKQHCSTMLARSPQQNGGPEAKLLSKDEKFDLWAIYALEWN
jgi:hypothetical protein